MFVKYYIYMFTKYYICSLNLVTEKGAGLLSTTHRLILRGSKCVVLSCKVYVAFRNFIALKVLWGAIFSLSNWINRNARFFPKTWMNSVHLPAPSVLERHADKYHIAYSERYSSRHHG